MSIKGITVAHSKVKNTGVLFEVLVRQITSDTLEGRPNSIALDLLKKYFSADRELGKELQLYQTFVNADRLNESRAVQYLDMVVAQRRRLDEKKLLQEKYELIKEIKKHYDLENFLSCKIPSYKLHASIYKTFVAESQDKNTSILNIQDVASARFTLLEHLLGHTRKAEHKESALLEEYKNQSEDLRLLSYRILIDRFNEKYDDLNEKQKTLLREYINDSASKHTLLNYVKSEVPTLQKELRQKIRSVKDKVVQIKLNEVVLQLDGIGRKNTVRDNEVTSLMIAYQIVKELGVD
jgi:hypothetical protein